jgi:Ca-activated chloride channel homolog
VNGRASTRVQLTATLLFAATLTAGLAVGTALIKAATTCEQVLIASSQEKATMLHEFADTFNRGHPKVEGRCVLIAVDQVNSGDAERHLAAGWTGPTRPDVWAPASTAWVKLLSSQLSASDAERILPPTSSSMFQSPLVIAMPQPMAAALDYPAKPLGWSRILELAQESKGWGAYGHTDWGLFKLGKTNPTVSTSGLHALIGAHYAAPGGGSLTVESVASEKVRTFIGQIETSVVHYGQTANEFLGNLRYADDQGAPTALRYISAIAVEEKELADYNSGLVAGVQRDPPLVKLVAVYPSGGTPVANHPYVVLGWSNPAEVAAARKFEEFIKTQKTTIEARHFRFGDPTSLLNKLVFPTGELPPLVGLEPPSGKVIAAMIDTWKSVRKPARVLMLIDLAVKGDELGAALNSLKAAASGFMPQDKVGIWTFPAPSGPGSSHTVVRAVLKDSASMVGALSGLRAVKGTSDLNGALRDAVNEMVMTSEPHVIDAVLVLELSHNLSPATADLVRFLSATSPSVRVFTIGPSSEGLRIIALAGAGAYFEPGSASHFLNDVISNF